MFLLLKPSDQPFHSPAYFNVISIAGIHFAYRSCFLSRASFGKLWGRHEQQFVNRICIKFEYITKVPYWNINNNERAESSPVQLSMGVPQMFTQSPDNDIGPNSRRFIIFQINWLFKSVDYNKREISVTARSNMMRLLRAYCSQQI